MDSQVTGWSEALSSQGWQVGESVPLDWLLTTGKMATSGNYTATSNGSYLNSGLVDDTMSLTGMTGAGGKTATVSVTLGELEAAGIITTSVNKNQQIKQYTDANGNQVLLYVNDQGEAIQVIEDANLGYIAFNSITGKGDPRIS